MSRYDTDCCEECDSREYTQEEVMERFLADIWALVRYWNRVEDKNKEEALKGLAFSFLSTLDGCSCDLPAFEVIPSPHPDDKEFLIAEGSNYYKPFELPEGTVTVHGNHCLHELFYVYGKKWGYCK